VISESISEQCFSELSSERRHRFFARLVFNLSIVGRVVCADKGAVEVAVAQRMMGLAELLHVIGDQMKFEFGQRGGYGDDENFLRALSEKAHQFGFDAAKNWCLTSACRSRTVTLTVDFNYGSQSQSPSTANLTSKSGNRIGLMSSAQAEFQDAGVEPEDGVDVVLIERAVDRDSKGRLCNIVAPAQLHYDDSKSRWWATYE
jgi:hypothetical protein